MTLSTDAIGRIHDITRTLETERSQLSKALATPACDGGAADVERTRLMEMHRRVTGAITALQGEARDW